MDQESLISIQQQCHGEQESPPRPRMLAALPARAARGGSELARLCFLSSTLELGLIEKEASLEDAVRAVVLAGGSPSLADGFGVRAMGPSGWEAALVLGSPTLPFEIPLLLPLGGKFCTGLGRADLCGMARMLSWPSQGPAPAVPTSWC